MVQRRRELRLGAETAEERGVLGKRGVEHLHRDATAEARVLGDVHAAARTGTDRAVEEVATGQHAAREVAHRASGHTDNATCQVPARPGTHRTSAFPPARTAT